MKKVIAIIAIIATTAAASAQSFEERVAIEVIRKQAQLEELDNYWAERGYYRVGFSYQSVPGYGHLRPHVGRTTKSAADLAKENPELF